MYSLGKLLDAALSYRFEPTSGSLWQAVNSVASPTRAGNVIFKIDFILIIFV